MYVQSPDRRLARAQQFEFLPRKAVQSEKVVPLVDTDRLLDLQETPRSHQVSASHSKTFTAERQSHLYLKSGKIFSANQPPNITDFETLLSCCWQGDLLRDPIL